LHKPYTNLMFAYFSFVKVLGVFTAPLQYNTSHPHPHWLAKQCTSRNLIKLWQFWFTLLAWNLLKILKWTVFYWTFLLWMTCRTFSWNFSIMLQNILYNNRS
jgi:hypothetical protein